MKSIKIIAAVLVCAFVAVGCGKKMVKDGRVTDTIKQDMVKGSYIEAIGIGASDPALPTDTQRKALARDAAIVKAQYELLTLVKGVQIEGGITVERAMETDSKLQATVKECIKGAEIVNTEFTKDGGAVVTLHLPKVRLEQMMGVKFK
ncbi:MAG: hypothetical protein WC969_12325 [Elusimicrobiota bacterium]|jgi:hypothetical protein